MKLSRYSTGRSSGKRLFHGLTQVCHQLRVEFLPLYRAQNMVHIYHYDFPDYVDMLVCSAGHEVVGDVAVDMHNGWPVCSTTVASVDILPVLKILKTAPKLTVRCGIYHCYCNSGSCPRETWKRDHIVGELWKISSNDAMASYVSEALGAIELSFVTFLKAKVKEGYWLEWMQVWNDDWYRLSPDMKSATGRAMKTWLGNLELPMDTMLIKRVVFFR